ncbi:MAG: ammonium transporter, partial [Pseudomonadota bacterium]|nr:ammonium transporter [Pseudomonadota bacterium]
AVTAEPLAPSPAFAIFVVAVGGLLVVITVPLLDKLKIDDVVGAIPVHLIAGIWGTIAVIFSNGDASIATQIIGIVAIGAFVVVTTGIVWTVLKMSIGIRVTEEEEVAGLDQKEIGMEAYPEFGRGSQTM